jgi:predicted phage tail protein
MEKHNIWIVILAFVSVVFIQGSFTSQSSAGQKTTAKAVKSEITDAAETIKDYSIVQRDQAVQDIKSILEDLDARIDKLENRIDDNWDQMSEAMRRETRDSLRMLRQQRNEVAEWYGGLQHSSADAWDDLKKGFSDAYTALTDAWKQAEKQFNSDKKIGK